MCLLHVRVARLPDAPSCLRSGRAPTETSKFRSGRAPMETPNFVRAGRDVSCVGARANGSGRVMSCRVTAPRAHVAV